MADSSKTELPTSGKDLPTMRVREIGFNGLSVTSGQVLEEADIALRYPQSIYTYKKMLKDSTVASAVEYVQTRMASVTWHPKAPKGCEEELASKVSYLKTVQNDMTASWLSTMKQMTSFTTYGFSVAEIVPYTRLYKNGSKFNDGLRGIKKLAFRSQDTISGVEYSEDGRDFIGYWQRVNKITNKSKPYRTYPDLSKGAVNNEVLLKKDNLLVFRNGALKDSPFGKSPLNDIYESFRYKKEYEQSQAYGINSDVNGLKVLYIPPQYMSETASPEDAAVFAQYQKIMRNLHIGAESGLILPQVLDDRGEQYFKFEVVNASGSKAYDVSKVIESYKMEILTALYATVLTAGQGGGGSFALSESLQEMVDMIITAKLEEMRDVLNHTLIPYLWKLNGWDMTVLPTFEFTAVRKPTLDEYSKAIQRIGAVKLIARTAKNVNAIGEYLDLPDFIDEDIEQDELREILGEPAEETKSSKGMSDGLNNGTGKSNGSSGDNSSNNSDNAA